MLALCLSACSLTRLGRLTVPGGSFGATLSRPSVVRRSPLEPFFLFLFSPFRCQLCVSGTRRLLALSLSLHRIPSRRLVYLVQTDKTDQDTRPLLFGLAWRIVLLYFLFFPFLLAPCWSHSSVPSLVVAGPNFFFFYPLLVLFLQNYLPWQPVRAVISYLKLSRPTHQLSIEPDDPILALPFPALSPSPPARGQPNPAVPSHPIPRTAHRIAYAAHRITSRASTSNQPFRPPTPRAPAAAQHAIHVLLGSD